MRIADPFLDANVLLYMLSADAAKADLAESIVASGGAISVQVLNEFVSVARRKLALTWPEIREILATMRKICAVEPMTEATHDFGARISERYGFTIYDGLIVAFASLAGCNELVTEDLQDGQVIEGVTIRNPFAAGNLGQGS